MSAGAPPFTGEAAASEAQEQPGFGARRRGYGHGR